jgi:hypothetical protein
MDEVVHSHHRGWQLAIPDLDPINSCLLLANKMNRSIDPIPSSSFVNADRIQSTSIRPGVAYYRYAPLVPPHPVYPQKLELVDKLSCRFRERLLAWSVTSRGFVGLGKEYHLPEVPGIPYMTTPQLGNKSKERSLRVY